MRDFLSRDYDVLHSRFGLTRSQIAGIRMSSNCEPNAFSMSFFMTGGLNLPHDRQKAQDSLRDLDDIDVLKKSVIEAYEEEGKSPTSFREVFMQAREMGKVLLDPSEFSRIACTLYDMRTGSVRDTIIEHSESYSCGVSDAFQYTIFIQNTYSYSGKFIYSDIIPLIRYENFEDRKTQNGVAFCNRKAQYLSVRCANHLETVVYEDNYREERLTPIRSRIKDDMQYTHFMDL